MELHAVDRQLAVPYRHDHAAVGLPDDFELVGNGLRKDRQRVVPGRGERIRETLQHPGIGVVHDARLTVQQLGRTVDSAAERHPDGLVAEADAQ